MAFSIPGKKKKRTAKAAKRDKGKPASDDRRQKVKNKDKPERKAVPQTPAPADQNTAPSASKPVSVQISRIVVGKRLRKDNKATVAVITESIREQGQLSPIWLRKREVKNLKTGKTSTRRVLIAGWHRMEAMKALGKEMIDAVYLDVDEQGAMLLEITENLDRGELTELERAEHIDKKVQIIDARRKAAQAVRQPEDKSISAAARELGHTRDDVRRSGLIARISDAAKAKAKELRLDDNQRALLRIAKQKEPDEQVALAEQLGGKKELPKKPVDAADKADDEETYAALKAAWEGAPKCQRAYREATENARRRFDRMLKGIPLPKKDDDDDDDDPHDDTDWE